MSELRSAPFYLDLNSLIVAKVSATNIFGTSYFSPDHTTGATIKTKPNAPPFPI